MLRLNRKTWIQLSILILVTVVSCGAMAFNFMKLPATLFGIGEYNVTVDLPQSGGLYQTSVVTYRGTDVGQVKSVDVTATGVRAVLALRSGVKVPSDVQASVHSRSAIGEQYIELTPLPGKDAEHSRLLRNGDVIPAGRVDVPVDIGHLLDLTNRALQAIPRDNLRTVIDETNRAVGGLGPELSRIVDGSTALAIAGGQTVDSLAPAHRSVPCGVELPGADIGCDRHLGSPNRSHLHSVQGAGCGAARSVDAGHFRAGGKPRAARSGDARGSGVVRQPGQPRRHRGRLPA